MPTETDHDLDEINVGEPEHWENGPPHELFKRLRGECPVHWSEIEEYPDEAGFWSVVTADGRPHRQPRLEDLLLRARRLHGVDPRDPARADDLDVHRAWIRPSTTG